MTRLFALALLLVASTARPEGLGLNEVFAIEKTPGSGSLLYKQGAKSETIDFGAKGGHYGVGVVFRGSFLPLPYSKDFEDQRIIQVALGTLKSQLREQVSQFTSATLILNELPKKRKTLRLASPGPSQTGKVTKELALLLFTGPGTPAEQTDEDKLKRTYFAEGGTISLLPVGNERDLQVSSGGKTLTFRTVNMRVEFDARLSTPFNTEDTTLKGQIEFPIYWPTGQDAKALARRIATESLGTAPTLPAAPEGLTSHKRGVAGSTKKDRP